MRGSYDGVVLASLKLTSLDLTVDLQGILPFMDGVRIWTFGNYATSDCFIVSATRSDLTVGLNKIFTGRKLFYAASDSAGKTYFGG